MRRRVNRKVEVAAGGPRDLGGTPSDPSHEFASVFSVIGHTFQVRPRNCRAMPPTKPNDISRVRAVLTLLEAGLRTIPVHGPGHPIHEQAMEKVRVGFAGLWERLSGLPLTVTDCGLQWEADDVLPVDKQDGLAWALSEAGLRFLAFSPGVEEEEARTFLAAIHRSRSLTHEDVDDLQTLLWTADFQYIRWKSSDSGPESRATAEKARPAAERARPVASASASATGPKADEVRKRVEEEVDTGGANPSIVDLDAYESTLYFLDTTEIRYLREEVEREYAQDLGRNVLSLLFDTFELQTDPEVRSEIIAILTDLLPQLLIGGDFRSVAYLLSEARLILKRAPEIDSDHLTQLNQLAGAMSAPGAVTQLMHALDQAGVEPSVEDLEEVLGELRPDGFATTLKWLHRFSRPDTHELLSQAVGRVAEARPGVIMTALDSSEDVVVMEALRLIGEKGLNGLSEQLEGLAGHAEVRIRSALVPVLLRVPTAQGLRVLASLLQDSDPDIRIAAVQGLSAHTYSGALEEIEAVVRNHRKGKLDLTEKRAFFEAYGSIAGEAAVPTLKTLILGGSLGRGRGDPDTRACATLALGHVGTRSARLILQEVIVDRDVLVRTAAAQALRQEVA